MRANHFIAAAVAVSIAIAVKVLFLSGPAAEASADNLKTGAGLDVSKMHENAKLPEQAMHDMTFVFSDGD